MVESIKQLNEICQKPHYRTVGNWMVRRFERPAALYITWLLLHTRVTAHQVTFAALLIGLSSGFYLAAGTAGSFLYGGLLLQLWYLLDHVDGQIARYRKSSSPEGLFYDYVMHHAVNFVPFFGAGWGAWVLTGDETCIFLGFMASVSFEMVAILNDCRSKTIHSILMAFTDPVGINIPEPAQLSKRPSLPPLKRLFSWVHKSCEAHVVMNVLTALGVIFCLYSDVYLRSVALKTLLFYYASAATFVWTAKLGYLLKHRKISEEISTSFRKLGTNVER
jgi:phosphatidylglycerophosphate synthase